MVVRQQRQRHSRSPASIAALVLAVVCLILLHLLLRPHHHSSLPYEAASVSGVYIDRSSSAAATAVTQQQQQQQQNVEPEPDLPPSKRPGGGGVEAARAALHGAPLVFVSFANGAFSDFINNWVLSVQRIKVPFLVGALDAGMVEVRHLVQGDSLWGAG